MKFAIIEKYPFRAKVRIFASQEDAFSSGGKIIDESELLENLEAAVEWLSTKGIPDEHVRIIPSANNNPQGELE